MTAAAVEAGRVGLRSVALAVGALPVMSVAQRRRLERSAIRYRSSSMVVGARLWLPRLGVSVLAHEPAEAGWLCTLLGADSTPPRLPTGVFVVSDLEIRTAFPTDPAAAMSATGSVSAWCAAWRVRVADHERRPALSAALLAHLDETTPSVATPSAECLTVATGGRGVLLRSGCRSVQGFRRACEVLAQAGFLRALFDDPGDEQRRYRVMLPGAGWPS